MDFKHYQYILKVAELQSITKAANNLYISQPSLSAFIAKIEDELGAKLFDRNKTPLELTQAGKIFVETGERILHLHEKMIQEINEISLNQKGKIKVGIPGSRGTYMLPLIYPAFHSEFPGIEIEMIENTSKNLAEAVQKGSIDIVVMPRLSKNPNLIYETIYNEELFLISQKHYLKEKDYLSQGVVDFSKLKHYPFILLKRGHGARKALDIFFEEQNMSPQILFETSNNSTALRMASIGEGLAIVPQMTIDICGDVKDIEILKLTEEGLTWNISAVIKKDSQDNYIFGEFIRIAKQVFNNK